MTSTKDSYSLLPEFEAIDTRACEFVERTAELLADAFEMDWTGRNGDPEAERIENESRDGFIPFTDGGWRAMPFSYIGHARGMGTDCGMLSMECEQAEEYARDAYMQEHDGTDPWELDLNDPAREEWYDYESQWLDSVWFIDARATYFQAENARNVTGSDEVMLAVFVNFDEYGRDKHATLLWELTLPLSAFSRLSDFDIASLAQQAAFMAQGLEAHPDETKAVA